MNSPVKPQNVDVPADGLLPKLKLETQSSHFALESHIDLIHRLKTVADYRKILEAFYGLISPMEARTFWPSTISDAMPKALGRSLISPAVASE